MSEISQTSNKNLSIHQRSKTPSKISIHNIYINKKVQIGKNFSKLKLDTKEKPNSPLLKNQMRKINRNKFAKNDINKTQDAIFINPSNGKSTKIKVSNKNKFPKISSYSTLNNTGNESSENSEKNKIKKWTKSKTKDYSTDIDNRKLSIMDIPSVNQINFYNRQKKLDLFFSILSKNNVLPFKLRLIFSMKSKYSKEDILKDYHNYLNYKKHIYNNQEKEFILFKPSKTIQCLLGFINKEDESEFIKKHSKYDSNNENEVILFNIFKIFYIILNKKIPENDNDIIINFFQNIFKEINVNNIRGCLLNKICKNLTLSKVELNTINMVLNNSPKIIQDDYLKSIEKEKIFFLIVLFIKELFEYSKKRFNFGNYMILYLYEKAELNKNK